MVPETNHVKSGDVHIAYQVLGQGPIDLIFIAGWVTHLELAGDLVVRSRIDFADRNVRALKGLPDEWHLFAVGSVADA